MKIRTWPLAALFLVVAAACEGPPLVHLRGRVLDPDTLQALAGVRVSWRESQTVTGPDGRYDLPVEVGGRQVTFELADRPPARKFVILDEDVGEQPLDALLPATAGPGRSTLALAREWAFAGKLRRFEDEWESGGDSNLSLSDRYGNDDRPLTLGHGDFSRSTDAPVFSKGGDFLFYALSVPNREGAIKRGVYRLPVAGGTPELLPRIDDGLVAGALALSPDGEILLGGGVARVYRWDGPAGATPVVSELAAALESGPDLAWGADGSLYRMRSDPGPLGSLVIRVSWPDLRVDELWGEAGGVRLSAPVAPLPDGSVLGTGVAAGGRIAIFRRTAAGQTSEVLSREVTDFPLAADLASGWLYYRARSNGGYDLHLRHLASGTDLVIVTGIKPGRIAVAPDAFAAK